MKLSALLAGMDIVSRNAPEMEITGVAYDSRTVKPGNLFVAIAGLAADGNRFIPMAMDRGAVVVVTERVPQEGVPYIQVPDARIALAQLGANWYDHPGDKLTLVGITGTNGKTSATLLLKSVLEQVAGKTVGLIGTIQNMIGSRAIPTERTTPESFDLQGLLAEMVASGCTYVVMEVSSHALTLERVGGLHFRAAAFTNLTEDHLDFHKTMESYAEAKAKLFSRCDVGVFNLDDSYCPTMLKAATCKTITCSERDAGADLYAGSVRLASDHVDFTLNYGGREHEVWIGIPGLFTAYNAMTVLGLAAALDLPMGEAVQALRQAEGVKGRVEVVPTPGMDFTVLIDYAHTPDGLENVLRSVRGYCKGRTVAVFGCGGDRDKAKRPIMGAIGVQEADFVVFTSDNPRTEDPHQILREIVAGAENSRTPYVVIENRRQAIQYALEHGQKDDIIVLAGKGHETDQEICGIKYHLDEREEVARWCAERNKSEEMKP